MIDPMKQDAGWRLTFQPPSLKIVPMRDMRSIGMRVPSISF
jgi:hypothetical protein